MDLQRFYAGACFDAMESRCYHGGEGRTRLKELRMSGKDVWLTVAAVVVFVAMGLSNFLWK